MTEWSVEASERLKHWTKNPSRRNKSPAIKPEREREELIGNVSKSGSKEADEEEILERQLRDLRDRRDTERNEEKCLLPEY